MLLRPDRWTWYAFELPESADQKIKLQNVELTRSLIDNVVPEHGFFARDHSVEYAGFSAEKRDVQRFEVDGQWDMREFGKLHAQISDLYALAKSIDAFEDPTATIQQKRQVVESFVKPFRGGGSYLSFFKSLAMAGGEEARPGIKAIQWASPGHIDVVGDQDAFDQLISLVDHYSKNRPEIVENYQHLWSYLQEAGFLKKTSRTLDWQSPIAVEIENRARGLARVLGATSYKTLKKMAGEDILVTAKVLLATQRRVARLWDFFSQGRVAVDGVEIE